jgi:hypothetical protein
MPVRKGTCPFRSSLFDRRIDVDRDEALDAQILSIRRGLRRTVAASDFGD